MGFTGTAAKCDRRGAREGRGRWVVGSSHLHVVQEHNKPLGSCRCLVHSVFITRFSKCVCVVCVCMCCVWGRLSKVISGQSGPGPESVVLIKVHVQTAEKPGDLRLFSAGLWFPHTLPQSESTWFYCHDHI